MLEKSYVNTEQMRRTPDIPNYKGMKVLLLEDEFYIAENMRYNLEGIGFTVIYASNPDEAEKVLLEHNFDLIIADNDCPEKGAGLDFIGKHRTDFAAKILHTGVPTDEKRKRINSYDGILVPKPATRSEILNALPVAFERGKLGAMRNPTT